MVAGILDGLNGLHPLYILGAMCLSQVADLYEYHDLSTTSVFSTIKCLTQSCKYVANVAMFVQKFDMFL